MDEAKIIISVILVTNNKTAEVMQPSEETFNAPSFSIPTQHSSVLRDGLSSVGLVRSYEFDTSLLKVPIERIRVIRSITDESSGSSSKEALLESCSNKGDLMRRSRCKVDGERKTRAVCHCHELGTLAPLGFPNTGAPFFATTKVASMKHSARLNLPRFSRSRASVSSTPRNTPERTHSWNLRWQVW